MLVGELPELLETRMAQDILEIGEECGLAKGRTEGLIKAVGVVLEGRRGRLTRTMRQRIEKLTSDQLCQLLNAAVGWESLEPLEAWLTGHDQ